MRLTNMHFPAFKANNFTFLYSWVTSRINFLAIARVSQLNSSIYDFVFVFAVAVSDIAHIFVPFEEIRLLNICPQTCDNLPLKMNPCII